MTMISQIDGNMIWERKCTQENVEAVGARCTQKVQGGKVTENTCKKTCTSKFSIHLYRISYTILDFHLATKCNNHLTMLDLTKMTVENAPENPESIKIEGSNPQNPNPLVLQADSPPDVTIKPSTSGSTLRLSLCSIFAIIFLFV